jgi:c-di-GMP-binding flagellar brake protein YcgR
VTSLPGLHVGQTVLVAPGEDSEPVHMLVDVVQDGQFTLATVDDVPIPALVSHVSPLVVTYVDRFAVYTVDAEVVRQGTTRLVCAVPDDARSVQRRQYARVLVPVDASCLLLDPQGARFTPFDATVRDIGGGGLAFTADAIAPEGAMLVIALALPGAPPIVVVGTVLAPDVALRGGSARRIVRVEFTLIREADRDKVLRFVLACLAGNRTEPA